MRRSALLVFLLSAARVSQQLDFFSGRRLEFLRVGSREPHPGDRAPRAEDPIGYADHRVDDSELPDVA